MASTLVTCEHCEGKKNCMRSGGKSCPDCLIASGRSKNQWATVRCTYCGGKGKVWMKVEESEVEEPTTEPEAAEAEITE